MKFARWSPNAVGNRHVVWHILLDRQQSPYLYWTFCDRDLEAAFVEVVSERPSADICKVCDRRAHKAARKAFTTG